MSEQFSIECEWLPEAVRGSAAERFSRAEVRIEVNHWCATEVEDLLARSVRTSARLSAYHLALWFVANWWRLRWEPAKYESETTEWLLTHRLSAAGAGYVWPNLTFTSDGRRIAITQQATRAHQSEPIRYLNTYSVELDVEVFEKGVDCFIETILSRLSAVGADAEVLQRLWNETREERNTPDLSRWRRLEALLGHDPGEGDEELITALQRAAGDYGEAAVGELAANSSDNALHDLEQLEQRIVKEGVTMQVADLDSLRARVSTATAPLHWAWQQAEAAADVVRATWSLDGTPISTPTLAEHLEIPTKHIQTAPPRIQAVGSAGLSKHDSEGGLSIWLNKARETSRRFALARLLGDYLTAGKKERLVPVLGVHTHRQKFQRAFAAALLCPYPALREFIGRGPPSYDRMEDAADYFKVSPILVQTVLVNKHEMDRATLPAN